LLGDTSRFQFAVFNPGNDVFELTAELGGGSVVVSGGILFKTGETLRQDLTLGDPGSISGTLRTFDPAVFHAVVPVQLINASNRVVATVLSDGSGRYAFTNVPPAEYQVRCQVLKGYRYLGVTNLVKYGDAASPTGLRRAQRLTLIAGQKIENADFTFAPFKKGSWKTFTTRDGLPGNDVRRILPLDDGTVWIATVSGLSIFDGATFKHLRKEDGLPDSRINDLHREPNGVIWICTGNGVSRFDPSARLGQQFRNYRSADGLISGKVEAVAQTPDGAMWFGGFGLSRFDGQRFSSLPLTNAGLDYVFGMAATREGALWLGCHPGLLRLEGTNFTTVIGYSENMHCTLPVAGPDGAIWFGTFGHGIWRYDPSPELPTTNRFRKYTPRDGLISDMVSQTYFDSRGSLWIATGGGVSRFDGASFVNFVTADGLAGGNIVAISGTSDGVLWFAADRGLTRYDPQSFESYTKADGLADNAVTSAARLADGTLLFGSGSGLNRFLSGTFVEVSFPEGESEASAAQLAPPNRLLELDGNGNYLELPITLHKLVVHGGDQRDTVLVASIKPGETHHLSFSSSDAEET